MKNVKFTLQKHLHLVHLHEPILPSRNKYLMLWFVKNGYKHQVAIYEEYTNITETITSIHSYLTPAFSIHLPYYIQRIGFSESVYEVNSKYYKINYLEKARGAYVV